MDETPDRAVAEKTRMRTEKARIFDRPERSGLVQWLIATVLVIAVILIVLMLARGL